MSEARKRGPGAKKPDPIQYPEVKASEFDIKNQPSDEALDKAHEESKPAKTKYVQVRTASGGDMWDPDGGQWVGGKPGLAHDSRWLRMQEKAGKIIISE